MGTCFECETNFEMEEGVEIGDIVSCPKCHTRYEVLSNFPIQLDYAAEEEEDS
jgi:lysine biosynthesis protein LysW